MSILNETGEKLLKDYIERINLKYPEECYGDDTCGEAVVVKEASLQDTDNKYSHYFKDVSNLESIDIYRVLLLWEVTHPCLQHAVKKILVAGDRGYKDIQKDVQEAIDSLERWKEMLNE